MSYDISFWKPGEKLKATPGEIHETLGDGEKLPGLQRLAVKEIIKQLKTAFPQFDPSERFLAFRIPTGTIEVSWSAHHFWFAGRGEPAPAFSRITKIMRGFGCVLFDPQTETLHGIDDPPPFDDPREAEEYRQRLRKEDDGGRQIGATCMEVGPFRVFFDSTTAQEPPHFYVQRERHVAKFGLDPLQVEWNAGFSLAWLDDILQMPPEWRDDLLDAWAEFREKRGSV